jgi:hypothetical protein
MFGSVEQELSNEAVVTNQRIIAAPPKEVKFPCSGYEGI